MLKRVINFIGIFLMLLGASMLLPLFTALVYGETSCITAFLISIGISFIPGAVITLLCRNTIETQPLKKADSYFIVSVSWILAAALAGLPFLIEGSITYASDAFFEMASAFTTTGSSILPDVEAVPKSLLLWRSECQWFGGMGIIVFAVALFPKMGIKAQNVAGAETPGPISTKLTSRFSETAQRLYLIYIAMTIILIILLMLGGVGFFDSVNHAFATMATGGFSTYGDSVAHFDSYYVYWVLTIFMLLAGTNFNLFFGLAKNPKEALADNELHFYYILFAVVTLLITFNLMIQGGYTNFGHALTDGAFQVSTIMTTTGFATTDFNLWPAFSKMLLLLIMIPGGMSSSTAGGMKCIRVLLDFRMIKNEVKLRIHGKIVDEVKYNGSQVGFGTLSGIVAFSVTYFATLLIGLILISFFSCGDFVSDLSAVLTCLNNVGPGLGEVGPISNFSIYSKPATMILSFLMIAGRLELITFFLLFTRRYWNQATN